MPFDIEGFHCFLWLLPVDDGCRLHLSVPGPSAMIGRSTQCMRWSNASGRGVQIVRRCSSISIYSRGLLLSLQLLFLAAGVTIPTAGR